MIFLLILQEHFALFCGVGRVQIGRCNVKNRFTAAKSFFLHTVRRARKGDQHARGEAGVRVQLQFVFYHVVLLVLQARFPCAEYNAAVGNARVVTV